MDIAKVERVYTSYSGVYDHIFGKIFHESREACVRNLRIRPEENILEVGVGTGIALEYYPKNCNITGIDLSSGMLAKARQRIEPSLQYVSNEEPERPKSHETEPEKRQDRG